MNRPKTYNEYCNKMRNKKGILFVVSAPSGAGKSTICSEVMRHDPLLRFVVSHTTREPRKGEENGVDYHFVTKDDFKLMVDAGEFLEWAEVHDNSYGTSKSALENLLAEGANIIHDIDVQGAAQLREVLPDAVYIFILPPSLRALKYRLSDRGTDTPEVVARRLDNAKGEIGSYSLYDYVILNDSLDRAVENFRSVVNAERLKVSRVDPKCIEEIFLQDEAPEAKEDGQQ